MKIALIQQHCSTDKYENMRKGLKAANRAADNGAEVICFAELAFEPFYPQYDNPLNPIANAETIPGPITDHFCSFAKERGVVVVLNLYEKSNNKTYDSSPVINTDGNILGITRMVHITDYTCFHERKYYTPGNNGAPVYDTRFGKIGVAICYDRHFPEYMRTMAIKGAEVVFIPQAGAVDEWPDGLYQAEIQTAAFQNGYFTALCNRVGGEEKLTFAGESFICSPDGQILDQAPKGKDYILISDLTLEEVNHSHAKRLFLKDRRPNLYKEWFT